MNQNAPTKAELAGNLSLLEKAGEILFTLRDYTPIPIIILALLFAEPTVQSLSIGVLVTLLGEAVRTYGVAFIGSISRTRSYSNGQLIQEGPFRLLRNPLYFGNLVLSFGLSLMPSVWWLPLVVVGVFYVQYIPIVTWEERKLTRIFGEPYLEYCRNVPTRWFPSLSRLVKNGWYERPDSWKPALRSERRTLTSLLTYTIVMGLLFYFQLQGRIELPLIQRLKP